jgi:hypothetical protein
MPCVGPRAVRFTACRSEGSSYISGAMYSVVAHNADPYLELDAPALFSNHLDALKYAIDTAIVFRTAEGGPTRFSISGPDGPVEWPNKTLLWTRSWGLA